MRNQIIEFRNPDHPWPDRPEIPKYIPEKLDSDDIDESEGKWPDFENRFEPPSEKETADQNACMLRQQRLFRWAAQSIAGAMSQLTEVQKVAAFGAVARPLQLEIPRFRQFRRHRIEILHECHDLDLAVWMTDLKHLKVLKRALQRGLSTVQDTRYGGVAHHQVDVHIFEAEGSAYRGRLCIFGECPKKGKRECLVPRCGEEPFLQQFERYRFNLARFEGEPKVVLFDSATGLLVRPPKIDEP